MRPILFLDSGLGGLTVLRETRVILPGHRIVYVADDAAFPYGGWEECDLARHLVALTGRLIVEHDPQVTVIACNTASTLVLDRLREAHPDHAFVGTVPAIKPAAERSRSRMISVLATPGTVRRAYTARLIADYAQGCRVTLVGAEQLAGLAEDHLRGRPVESEAVAAEAAPCFVEQDGLRTDIVVLACTHFPLIANRMRQTAPWPVDWIDPAEAIARRIGALCGQDREDRLNCAGNDAGETSVSDEAILTSGPSNPEISRIFKGFGLKAK